MTGFMRKPMKSSGFTLIESLVALSILAIALIVVIKAAGNMNGQQAELIRRLEAQWSADNIATTLRISKSFPPVGEQTLDCTQGRAPLQCTVTVLGTPNPAFRKINIRVSEPAAPGYKGDQLANLVMFLSNAQ